MKLMVVSLLLTTWFSTVVAEDPAVKTVDYVDLQRYAGKWYELARIPNRFQKNCARDVTADYSVEGDVVKVHNSCIKAGGSTTTITGRATVADKVSNAKLKVTFFWPFSGEYWVLGLDPEYRWAVVGSPKRKYLWILSRSKKLPKEEMEHALRIAEQNGYSAASILPTVQSPD